MQLLNCWQSVSLLVHQLVCLLHLSAHMGMCHAVPIHALVLEVSLADLDHLLWFLLKCTMLNSRSFLCMLVIDCSVTFVVTCTYSRALGCCSWNLSSLRLHLADCITPCLPPLCVNGLEVWVCNCCVKQLILLVLAVRFRLKETPLKNWNARVWSQQCCQAWLVPSSGCHFCSLSSFTLTVELAVRHLSCVLSGFWINC